ncbi:MAG: DUF4349 domain-containing protein [Candidatus Onthomonas sp.]
MKRNWKPIPLLLALLLTLAACGASGGSANDSAATASEPMAAMDTGYGYYGVEVAETEEAYSQDTASTGGGQTSDSYAQAQVKLIYTASLEIEVLDFDAALDGLTQLVEELGGYCENSNFYNYGRSRSADYTVRVPSEHYRAFLDACSDWDNCHLLSRSEDVQNVGEVYFDTETRLATLRTKMERLQDLLAQATEMEDIITIESAISETEYQIEQYTSDLNRYDSLIGYATVHLYLDEVLDLTEEEEVGLAERLGQNLRWGAEHFLEGLEDLLLWAAYNIIGIIIFLLLLAAVILGVGRVRNGRKGKIPYRQTKQKPEPEALKTEQPEDKTAE